MSVALLDKPVVGLKTPADTVIVGNRDEIPVEHHRFALSSGFEVQAALSPIMWDPHAAKGHLLER